MKNQSEMIDGDVQMARESVKNFPLGIIFLLYLDNITNYYTYKDKLLASNLHVLTNMFTVLPTTCAIRT